RKDQRFLYNSKPPGLVTLGQWRGRSRANPGSKLDDGAEFDIQLARTAGLAVARADLSAGNRCTDPGDHALEPLGIERAPPDYRRRLFAGGSDARSGESSRLRALHAGAGF